MKVKPHPKPSEKLVPKPEPAQNPTNQRFVFSYDDRAFNKCSPLKPEPGSKIY